MFHFPFLNILLVCICIMMLIYSILITLKNICEPKNVGSTHKI